MPPYPAARVAAALGGIALLAFLAATIWAITEGSPDSVPTYALDSGLVFRVEQIGVLTALVTLPAAVIAMFLAGFLPMKMGKGGLEWQEAKGNVVATLKAQDQRLDALEESIRLLSE